MTIREKATLYVYGPDGDTLISGQTIHPGTHVPREGELVKTTDHTDDGSPIAFTHEEMLVVSEVQTEFRLCDNIGRGESWLQLVYVRTEEQSVNSDTAETEADDE